MCTVLSNGNQQRRAYLWWQYQGGFITYDGYWEAVSQLAEDNERQAKEHQDRLDRVAELARLKAIGDEENALITEVEAMIAEGIPNTDTQHVSPVEQERPDRRVKQKRVH